MLGVSPLKRTTLPVANKTNGDRMAKKKEAQEESLEKRGLILAKIQSIPIGNLIKNIFLPENSAIVFTETFA
jgi:hypothetical protein